MYNWAKTAFDSDLDAEERRCAFNNVYENLKRGWRVFRKAPGGHWSADETYDALTNECSVFSRQSGLTLLTLYPESEESQKVLAGLEKLRNLKRTKWYPWMPVAKFTHFFNPGLFPIYDTAVIWNLVLNGVFKSDYIEWCEAIGVGLYETETESARFNLTYTLMAGDILRKADESFMSYFIQWFQKQVTDKNDERGILEEISTYYATAFEFVAIGAAHL